MPYAKVGLLRSTRHQNKACGRADSFAERRSDIYYSQFGEDKILYNIFQRKTAGVCIEVGANNGIDDSTSLFFEKIGWKCILVEPNPSLCRKIREERTALLFECAASNRCDTTTLFVVEGAARSDGLSSISTDKEVHDRIKSHGFVSSSVQVRTMTLDRILMDAQINGGIDFISIDVEGHELEALQGFSLEQWKPKILLIEDNSNFENAIVNLHLKKFGYVRFMRTGVNDWYAHATNSQFVNIKNILHIQWIAFGAKIKNRFMRNKIRLQWVMIAAKIKGKLRKIQLLVTMRNMLRKKGVR